MEPGKLSVTREQRYVSFERACYSVIRFLLVLFIGTCVGCTTLLVEPHPLNGKIVDTESKIEINPTDVHKLIALADVVYLGEIHDNPWHHRIQLKILQQLVSTGARPALGLEVFSINQTGDLMGFSSVPSHDKHVSGVISTTERQIRNRLGWGKDREQEWKAYYPLIDHARQEGLPLFGIDLPVGIRRRITEVGIESLSPVAQRLVVRTGFSNAIYAGVMREALIESHCGWNDSDLLNNLYQTWVARNDTMATAISDMLSTSNNRPIVVIVGSGHTKFNMGVFERVEALVPNVKQVNIGLTPTIEGAISPGDYIVYEKVNNGAARPNHEYLWFTAALDREDPCIQFKVQLEKHNQSKQPIEN